MNAVDKTTIDHIPHISEMVQARTYDSATRTYETKHGAAIMVEILPFIGMAESDIKNLNSMIAEIDLSEATIQVISWASSGIGEALDRWSSSRLAEQAGGKSFGFGVAREEYFKNVMGDRKKLTQNWRPKHYRSFIIVHLDGTINSKRIDELSKLHGGFEQSFKTLGTVSRNVDPNTLLSLYHEMLTPNLSEIRPTKIKWSEHDYLNEQVASPGLMMNVDFKGISYAGEHKTEVKAFSVTNLPQIWQPGASAILIGDIFRTSDFTTETVLQCLSFRTSSISQDLLGIKAGRASKAANSPLRFVDPGVAARSADFEQSAGDMAKGHKMMTAHYQCILYARNGLMRDAETRIRSLFEANGFNLVADDGVHLPALDKAMPFGSHEKSHQQMKRFGRTRTIKDVNALTLMPLFGEWQGNDHAEPALMLLAGRRGELSGWTPFCEGGNNNTCIVGMSGQGKSVAMQEIMARLITIGGAAVVIDDGYSFQNSCEILGGNHIDFSNQQLELNPFAAIDPSAMSSDPDFAETAIAMLRNFIGAICHPKTEPNDLERSILTGICHKVWGEKGINGTIADVMAALKTRKDATDNDNEKQIASNLITLLGSVAPDGVYGRMFNHSCSVKMDSDLIVFEMSALRDKPEVQAASMVLLIFLATQKMYGSPRNKPVAVIVDEAWALLEGTTGDFIEGVARRARKYNGALITATQGVDDYFRSSAAEAAWANSDWRIFLKMQDASINALKKEQKIECDEILERGLRSLQSLPDIWSEMIVHGTHGWDIGRLILDQVSLTAYSSTGADVEAINLLIKNGMSRQDAITNFAKSKEVSNE